jgi:hypothetical protein
LTSKFDQQFIDMSGLINHDIYTTKSGLELTEVYITAENQNVSTRKGTDNYIVQGVAEVYINKDAFIGKFQPIDRIPIKVLAGIQTPMGSVYEIILTHLKGQFANHTVA